MQVWYDRHIEIDHTDINKEVHAAVEKGEFYGNWHVPGMQHMHEYLQKVMKDNGRVGGRVHHKLKGDLRNNSFGAGKHVRHLPLSSASVICLNKHLFPPGCKVQ